MRLNVGIVVQDMRRNKKPIEILVKGKIEDVEGKEYQTKYKLWQHPGGIVIEKIYWVRNENCTTLSDIQEPDRIGLRYDYIDKIIKAIQKLREKEK